MKAAKIIFWSTTSLIFLTQGVLQIFMYNQPESIEMMKQLGYPSYFGLMLAIFKLIGGLALIVPMVPKRIKEWAYAGFGIDFIAAYVSIVAVDGFVSHSFFPIVAILILIASYWSWNKISE